jgi:hypothetical protein
MMAVYGRNSGVREGGQDNKLHVRRKYMYTK